MRREKNILKSLLEGKKYPAHQGARKKNLVDYAEISPPALKS